jgi:hypothetical protein
MTVTFTLTSGSSGTAAGPFNISGTTNTNVVSWLATGITKTQLTTGHTITGINDAITGGTIASTGTCNTTTTWSTTPNPTPTPTALPCECYTIYNESGDRSIIAQYNRCSDGQLTNISVPSGSNRSVCIQSGGDVTSEDIGLLTVVACGTPCSTNDDCTLPCV